MISQDHFTDSTTVKVFRLNRDLLKKIDLYCAKNSRYRRLWIENKLTDENVDAIKKVRYARLEKAVQLVIKRNLYEKIKIKSKECDASPSALLNTLLENKLKEEEEDLNG